MNIVFHHPLAINEDGHTASTIRPNKMLNAFRQLGFSVDVAAGFSKERKKAMQKIKENILQGRKYAFVYAESSTKPNALADPHHIPIRPTIDFHFFRFLNSHNIPIGLFYRDIYWRFDLFQKEVGFCKANLSKAWFWYDLWQYNRYIHRMYLPSLKMADYVPMFSAEKMDALPPGHDITFPEEKIRRKKDGLHLLYIGGVGIHYQLQILFEVVQQLSGIKLTVCTRESDWTQSRMDYGSLSDHNIHIVHNSNNDLVELYSECDIAVLYVKPQPYRQFAVPFKLFEYIGHAKPVLASAGTMVGQMVEEMGAGWVVPYFRESLYDFLCHIKKNPEEIREKQKNIKEIAEQHTWLARARKVANDFV